MGNVNVRGRYVSDGAGLASQPQLLVMLYDRLILDLEQGAIALDARCFEQANDKLVHAQAIILELHSALNTDTWDGAAGLQQLYAWFNNELVDANVKKDSKPVNTCLGMIRDLRETWKQALESMQSVTP